MINEFYQIKKELEYLIDANIISIENVLEGRSGKNKFKVLASNNMKYLLRELEPRIYEERVSSWHILTTSSVNIAPFIGIINSSPSFAVFKWIEGELLDFNSNNSYYYSIKMGLLAARTLYQLHDLKVNEGFNRSSFSEEMKYYLTLLKNQDIVFNKMDYILQFLNDNSELISTSKMTYVHMDFHSKNLVYSKDHKTIWMIDNENISISNPWRDFCYAVQFHKPAEDLFWYTVVTQYFNNNIPDDFWEIVRLFNIIQFIRMLIHSKNDHAQYEFLTNDVAKSIYYDIYSSNNIYPEWMKKYFSHNKEIGNVLDEILEDIS